MSFLAAVSARFPNSFELASSVNKAEAGPVLVVGSVPNTIRHVSAMGPLAGDTCSGLEGCAGLLEGCMMMRLCHPEN